MEEKTKENQEGLTETQDNLTVKMHEYFTVIGHLKNKLDLLEGRIEKEEKKSKCLHAKIMLALFIIVGCTLLNSIINIYN